jgi:hypothetical protein
MVHCATGSRESKTLQIPRRWGLEDALVKAAEPLTGVPYAEPARRRLHKHAERVCSWLKYVEYLPAGILRSSGQKGMGAAAYTGGRC